MKALNSVLIILVVTLLLANGGLMIWEPIRGWEFMPEMVDPVAAETLGASPLLPNEMVQQNPVMNSVARGHIPFAYPEGEEGRSRAGRELRNPLAGTDGVILRGKGVFLNYCFPCHGQEGAGDGPVVARGFPAPPALTAEAARKLSDGEIFHILTYGRANMPPYRYLVTPDERWAAIRYIRTLREEGTQ